MTGPGAEQRARPGGAAPRRTRRWALPAAAALAVVLGGNAARAAELGIFRVDPLGVDPQMVARLRGLLRVELGRLADASIPGPAAVQAAIRRRPTLQDCTGEPRCLAVAGRLLGVERIISGNVGGLAGQYVLNLKMVDVATGKEVRRIQEPITGDPDQLIEAVRVAAYALVAPERLRGSLAVLVDRPGAAVHLDGERVGTSPTPVLHGIKCGEHQLRVSKQGYQDVVQPVRIRFQKTARVVVKMEPPPARGGGKRAKVERPHPWYTRWWFWTVVGVVAAGAGAGIGYGLAGQSPGINCDAEPGRCGL